MAKKRRKFPRPSRSTVKALATPAAVGAAVAIGSRFLPASVKGGYLEPGLIAAAGVLLAKKKPAIGTALIAIGGMRLAQRASEPGQPLAKLLDKKSDAGALTFGQRSPNLLPRIDREVAEAAGYNDAGALYGPSADRYLSLSQRTPAYHPAPIADPIAAPIVAPAADPAGQLTEAEAASIWS